MFLHNSSTKKNRKLMLIHVSIVNSASHTCTSCFLSVCFQTTFRINMWTSQSFTLHNINPCHAAEIHRQVTSITHQPTLLPKTFFSDVYLCKNFPESVAFRFALDSFCFCCEINYSREQKKITNKIRCGVRRWIAKRGRLLSSVIVISRFVEVKWDVYMRWLVEI